MITSETRPAGEQLAGQGFTDVVAADAFAGAIDLGNAACVVDLRATGGATWCCADGRAVLVVNATAAVIDRDRPDGMREQDETGRIIRDRGEVWRSRPGRFISNLRSGGPPGRRNGAVAVHAGWGARTDWLRVMADGVLQSGTGEWRRGCGSAAEDPPCPHLFAWMGSGSRLWPTSAGWAWVPRGPGAMPPDATGIQDPAARGMGQAARCSRLEEVHVHEIKLLAVDHRRNPGVSQR
jgi:hypothetical protein